MLAFCRMRSVFLWLLFTLPAEQVYYSLRWQVLCTDRWVMLSLQAQNLPTRGI